MQNNQTKAWELYELGRAYNNRLEPNQYNLVNTNIAFFTGDQWIHMPDTPAMRRLPKPVFNIIKRVASLFVASLTSSGVAIQFAPLSDQEGDADAAMATAEVGNLLEKFKMEYRVREALFDGAQTGDYCAHFYWNPEARPYGGSFGAYKGEIEMELVDGINVMFGNPADNCVERQPYILLLGRDTVEHLRQEAAMYNPAFADEDIQPDMECGDMAGQGGQTELNDGGKALYVYLYTKLRDPKTGEETVHVTKATRTAVIYENINTGLRRYPVAWGNWEKQKNQYHGRALVTGIIPNQIFINTMFAMVMRHLQLLGFPKTVYNADLVGQWSNEVGQAIGVRGLQPGQPISQVAYNLQPADMSGQILTVIDRAVAYTKDCLGATDAQMGNVKPDNTSALMVLQSSAEVPLENTRAGLYEWMEDIGAILLDMMGTYYGKRPVVRKRQLQEITTDGAGQPVLAADGTMETKTVERRVVETYDFSRFRNLWLQIRVDVGASSYFSEIAMTQTLDNLRQNGTLDIIQYLERLPDRLIPRKAELVEELKKAAAQQAEPTTKGQRAMPTVGGSLSADKVLAQQPASVQAAYENLPDVAKRAIVKKGSL